MSTEPERAEAATHSSDDVFSYPLYKVVSVFTDPDAIVPAVEELRASGFGDDEIEAFCGWQGMKEATDYDGTQTGIWEHFVHAVEHIGPNRTQLEGLEKHLQDGHCIIMVKVSKNETKAKAAEVLHHHTNEKVIYFGLLMTDEIK